MTVDRSHCSVCHSPRWNWSPPYRLWHWLRTGHSQKRMTPSEIEAFVAEWIAARNG